MLVRPSILLLSLVAAALPLVGCGGETARNPIEPGGEIPPLLATMPDGDYLAVGYLDIDRLVSSDIGRQLLDRLSLANLMLAAQGIDLRHGFHELSFAVGFVGRAYPNLVRALPLIAVLRADIKPETVLTMLQAGETERFEAGGTEVIRFQINTPQMGSLISGAGFVAFPREGLIVLSTSRKMLERYVERGNGVESGIGGAKSAAMLARADKRVPGWMVLRHSAESRSLLQMLAGFDDCIISLDAGEVLEILCVMDFPSVDGAEESIKYFDFLRRQLESFKEKAEAEKGYEKLAGDISLNFTLAFKAERSADLAIYSARFDSEWFAKISNIQPVQPEEEP
ncbi:MAG TPA: hypothetical protein VMX35_10945 [Acidobacteriota bacterium]|nr:hypothetical protein [Acidobacteriota bacterium]